LAALSKQTVVTDRWYDVRRDNRNKPTIVFHFVQNTRLFILEGQLWKHLEGVDLGAEEEVACPVSTSSTNSDFRY
jgi:hypothetical protein